MSERQLFRSVCPVCENVHESHAGDLNLHVCDCGEDRKIFTHPEEDRECAAYYAWKHPAAAAEAKAVVAQLGAGADPNDVAFARPSRVEYLAATQAPFVSHSDGHKLGPRLTDVKTAGGIQATFVPQSDWRRLPKKPALSGAKPCGCRLNITCDECRPFVDWRKFVQGTRTNARGLREVQVGNSWYVDTGYELDRREKGAGNDE